MKKFLTVMLSCIIAAATLSLFPACGSGDNGGDDTSGAKDYFKAMTMTEGDLLVYGRTESLDRAQQFFAESVQGVFAQDGDSRYYHYSSGAYATWLEEITTVYGKQTRDVTVEEMLADYTSVKGTGYVLFDASGGDDLGSYVSVNCARSIAGAKKVAMVDLSLKSWADAHGMVQMYDATEMTEEECFNSFKNDFDKTGLVQQSGKYVYLTDYAIACRYYCYFVTGTSVSELTFRNTVQQWCNGCAVYGWCPIDEGTDVAFSSRYGSFTLASDYCLNMSVFSCTEFFGAEMLEQPFRATEEKTYPTDKHYITIVNSDGDNLQCWYGGTFESSKYMGATRGDFAMGWSVSPALYSLAPNILEHIYSNAKAGDSFVCSVSGLGYTYPMVYSVEALERYCSVLNEYLGKCDLSVVKILDNGLAEQTVQYFSQMSNAKGFLYCTYSNKYVGDHGSVVWSDNGKPFVSCRATMWDSTPQAIADQINAYPADATTIEGYTYVNLHVWSMDYNDVKAMVELLDDDVVVVDPETFIDLIVKNVPHENVTLTA